MDFTTELENGNIHLYCTQDGHKVSDKVLTADEARTLASALTLAIYDRCYTCAYFSEVVGNCPLHDRDVTRYNGCKDFKPKKR